MTWILIVMMHVGVMGDGNSNALTSIGGFQTQQACEQAGLAAKTMAHGTVKEIKYICARSQ